MASPNILTALGLKTASNELGSTPAGGLRVAQNCVVDGDGIVGPRRGLPPIGYAPTGQPRSFALFGETLIVNTVDINGDYYLEYDTGSAFVAYPGTETPPNDQVLRMKSAFMAQCLYLTTTKGVKRLDVKENAPVLAGGPRTGQIASATLQPTTVGYLPDGSSVAYRLVFGVKDANGIVHLGPPSGRIVVDNDDGAARNVAITFPVPDGSPTRAELLAQRAFWQVYRSRSAVSFQTQDGVSVYVPPDDELYLCQEAYFEADGPVPPTSVAIVDTTPDDFLGAPLYTNATRGEGILQSNDAPPIAYDITPFDQRLFFANTRRYPQVVLQIVGVGVGQDGYTGVRLGDQITVLGSTFTAAESYSVVDATFKLFTTGDPEENITNTAQSLVNLVNASNAGVAQLLSIQNAIGVAIPGQILFQSYALDATVWEARLTTKKFDIAIGGMTRSGTTVTVTTASPHGLVAGDTVRIDPTGAADSNYAAGTYTVATPATVVPGATTFTITGWAGTVTPSTTAYTERRLTPEPQFAWSPAPPATTFAVAVGGLVRLSNVVTVVTDVAHGLSVDMRCPIQPVGAADANFVSGDYLVTEIISSTSFKVSWVGSNATSTTAYQSGARVTSDPSRFRNALYWSKDQQPEAVPATNYIFVGPPDKDILRILSVQNYLFVHTDAGVYVVSPTGNAAIPYQVDPLDLTVQVYAADSVQSLGGRIYALTNFGVVEITSSGKNIVSDDIDNGLGQYFGATLTQTSSLRNFSFAVTYETDGLYGLWLPPLNSASEAPAPPPYNEVFAYVYSPTANNGSGAWTTWQVQASCGVVRATDNALFLGAGSSVFPEVLKQRNTQTSLDFADIETELVVNGWDSTTRTMTVDDTSSVQAGDAVVQDAESGIVTEVVDATHLVLSGGSFDISVFASGNVDLSATSAGPCGVSIMGHNVTVPYTGDPDADALALYDAILADATASQYVIPAESPYPPIDGIVLLIANTANYPGASGNTITLAALGTGTVVSAATLEGGADATATNYQAIDIDLEWRTVFNSAPAIMRTSREMHLHSRLRQFYKAELGLSSELVETEEIQTIYPAKDPDTDDVPAYSPVTTTYYGRPVRPKKLRVGLPQAIADAAYFNFAFRIREAFALWTLNGFTIIDTPVSEKGQR